VVLGPSIYVVGQHCLAPSKWQLPRRINQQRTHSGNLCLAHASHGRMETIFDLEMSWMRMFNLRLGRPFLDSSASLIVFLSASGKIPCGVEDGCSWNQLCGDDQGHDCFFLDFWGSLVLVPRTGLYFRYCLGSCM
jgi:hypothetical protein